jgi:hypothetical protein
MTKLVRVVAWPGRRFRRHHVCGLHEARPFGSSHSAPGVIRSHLVDTRPSSSRRASATPAGQCRITRARAMRHLSRAPATLIPR